MTKLTDGQIAEILETVDTAEIEQAQLALEKASNADIRSFATHMVQQHTASKQSGEALASRSNMKLDSSPITTNLRAKHEQVMQKLKAVDAAGFDSLYHTSQVDQHTETLAMIDDQLIPAVNDSALRDHLANARGMVQQHLEQAQKLRP